MIRRTLRLFGIAMVLARYRLDDLIVELPPLKLARVVRLLPWGRKGVRELGRGARLRLALQELGPIYVKFGQILSTRRDLLPHDIADELAQLQDNVPPFPGAQARAIIERELGKPVEQLFRAFDEEPLASASIAQVHAAVLHDGSEVVAKVVRPGIEARIRDDLELLESLAGLVRRYHPEGDRIRPNEVVAEFRRFILDEVDMQREGANASLLRRNWEDSDELYIPKIHWSHTADRVLVMERVGGVPVRDIDELKRQGVDLERLARRGIRVFYQQVFRDNLFHADMHPGNIRVDTTDPADASFIALDFGIVASLTPRDLYYIGENFLAIFNRDYRRVAELHVEAEWVPADTRIDEMEAAARTVCEPSFTRPLEEVSFGEMVVSLFEVARRFKLTLQPQLIMLQKTLLNIEGMGRDLYPKINIWDVAKPELERIFRERYGFRRTAAKVTRELPAWLARGPEVPNLVLETLKLAARGRINATIASSDLARIEQRIETHNRRVPGAILSAGLLVASAVLAAYQVGPWLAGHSVPAIIGFTAALVIAMRSVRG
ncbi:MAG: ubiquinone biosynthesis regulatory protein kinase UbiB [Gammaproteobacteria bacterium HGW-Gammaproteobacteria-8]|nr:MAG: ubiquinone biosynthesis regulatory protein kinase UbiB [Gammaproteobacteria bacterium HGW-Gammaproteobacteria-8]